MADEEKTDWTGIAARLKHKSHTIVEGTHDEVLREMLGDIASALSILALAEAERRVEEQECRTAGAREHSRLTQGRPHD